MKTIKKIKKTNKKWIQSVTESLTLRLFALLPFAMYYTRLQIRYKITYAKIITVFNTIQCGKWLPRFRKYTHPPSSGYNSLSLRLTFPRHCGLLCYNTVQSGKWLLFRKNIQPQSSESVNLYAARHLWLCLQSPCAASSSQMFVKIYQTARYHIALLASNLIHKTRHTIPH